MTTFETLPSESAYAHASLENIDVLSLSSLSSSPYSEVVSLEDSAAQPRIPLSIPNSAEKHERFYFTDEHIQLLAGNKLFRVHAYLFERESEEARALIKRSWVNADRLVELDGIDSTDLERFFEVLYCRVSDTPSLSTKEEWTSVLQLAHLWRFKTLHAMAMRELSTITTCVDRIVFGRTYGAVAWLEGAYHEVCEREDWLSDAEGRRLGLDDVLKIGSARAQLRHTGEFRSTFNDERANIIKSLFADQLDPASPLPALTSSLPPYAHSSALSPTPVGDVHYEPLTGSSCFVAGLPVAEVSSAPNSTQQPKAAHTQAVVHLEEHPDVRELPFYSPISENIRHSIDTILAEITNCEDRQSSLKASLVELESTSNPQIKQSEARLKQYFDHWTNNELCGLRERLSQQHQKVAAAEDDTAKAHQCLSELLFFGLASLEPVDVSLCARERLRGGLAVLSQVEQNVANAHINATSTTTKAQDRSANVTHWSQIYAHTPAVEVAQALETAKRQSVFASEQKAKAIQELEAAETKLAFAHLRFAELLNTLVQEVVDEAGTAGDAGGGTSTTIAPAFTDL